MNIATARIENVNTFHIVALERYVEGRDGLYEKGNKLYIDVAAEEAAKCIQPRGKDGCSSKRKLEMKLSILPVLALSRKELVLNHTQGG